MYMHNAVLQLSQKVFHTNDWKGSALAHRELSTTSVIINQRGRNGDDQDFLISKCLPNDRCDYKKLPRDLITLQGWNVYSQCNLCFFSFSWRFDCRGTRSPFNFIQFQVDSILLTNL